LRLKDLLGPVTRVKKKKKKETRKGLGTHLARLSDVDRLGTPRALVAACGSEEGSYLRLIDLCIGHVHRLLAPRTLVAACGGARKP